MPFRKILNRLRRKPAVAPLIIVAPDKFKGTLTADEVARCIASAVMQALPDATVRICPMADGGEGTAAIIASLFGLEPRTTQGHDALMRPTGVDFYLSVDGKTAAVDSAAIVGLAKLRDTPLRPWESTSFGVGEFISHMMATGVERLYVGIGGTASIDGGIGMLQALGARFFDVEGEELSATPLRAGHLQAVFSADFSAIQRQQLKQMVIGLADVDVPLTDADPTVISSASFACQKGLPQAQLPALTSALGSYAAAIDATLHPCAEQPPFQGAGGGIGYVLSRVLRCTCLSGAETVLESYNIFPGTITHGQSESNPTQNPSCIITGEGCFDRQSLHGKVAGTILAEASTRAIPVIIVAGCIANDETSPLPHSQVPTKIIATTSQPPAANLTHDTALANLQKTMPGLINSLHNLFSNQ